MFSQIERQIFKSWREYAVAPRIAKLAGRVSRNNGPRIAVVGNCQAFGVAYAMKVMDPTATVDHFSAIGRSRFANMNLLVKTLETYDYVFTHDFLDGHVKGGGSEDLLRRIPKAVLFPAVTFAAFHPDLIYIQDTTKTLHGFIEGPLGPYHSAIALFAHRAGLSLIETQAMFNENVFEALGYLDIWNEAAQELIEGSKARYGIDLSTDLMNWSRRGVFMYSLVHPMTFVLYDLAKRLWEKVGLTPPSVNFNYYDIYDLARSEIFPIYPPIAKIFGVQGGYLFKNQNHHISYSVGEFLTLPQFLAACFETYQKAGAARLANPRVDAWLADEKTKNYLIRLGRENLAAGRAPVL
jgi:hypothetical protein